MPHDAAHARETAHGTGDDGAEPVVLSRIDEKDEHDIRLQQVIDAMAHSSEGRPHDDVVSELAERIAGAGLPAMPQPWLDAVAASAISGNAYVVSRTSAALSDVPQPETRARQEEIT
ncbi:MAG TPA: hypothetical protein VFL38_11825 [Humibacillus xanthopallidus]|nr:hypothetical protein [Humibacillus xanthopallidus]